VSHALTIVLVSFSALASADELPKHVLHQLAWSFAEKPATSQKEFVERVSAYQKMLELPPWHPDEVAIPVAEIEVVYDLWMKPGQKPFRIRVKGKITAGELLYQIHQSACRWFADMDHHFFEGLDLIKNGRVPVYALSIGS
jgi:hypothetical protein